MKLWSIAPTDVGVEDLLHHQLKELFGHAPFVNTLLPLKLYVELLLQVSRVLHGDHLQLQDTHTERGRGRERRGRREWGSIISA